jgi:hypothetical protein
MTNLTYSKLLTMMLMQNLMNEKVNPNWMQAGYPYLRAVYVEGVEALDHVGWKWWKSVAQSPDLDQFALELVDIWHFALSDALIAAGGDDDLAAGWMLADLDDDVHDRVTFDEIEYSLSKMEMRERIDLMIGLAAAKRFDIALFETLMLDCGMDWNQLYRLYIGKNVLNMFRQDNGYKQGTYQKDWFGKEDNEHLTDILIDLNVDDLSYSSQIYGRLADRYAEVTAK